MATNTLTGLIPILYEGLDVVSREMVGFCRNCTLDAKAEEAALNQTITSHVAPAAVTEDVTPGQTPADSGAQTIGTANVVLTKSKDSPIQWTGEEQMSVRGQLNPIMVDQVAQSIRALVNLVEIDLATEAYKSSSRAYGTAGTTPFASAGVLSDVAQILKILEDNGAPEGDLSLILNSSAVANIRGVQSGLFEVNRAGNDDLLRRGILGDLQGLAVGKSGGLSTVTKGTGSSYVTNLGSTLAVGAADIAIDTGSGTVLAGDIVTFAGDANKYVVKTGVASAGTITINEPGLQQTLADGVAMTIGNNFTPNVAYSRSSLVLAARGPAMPVDSNGKAMDAADDLIYITDPLSGISFQVVMYRQYRRVKYEIALAWGVAGIKADHSAILLG